MSEQLQQIPLKQISIVSNVRGDMDAKALDELVQSVAQGGIRQPLIVRPARVAGQVVPKKFELVTGHRRHAAAEKLELESVPCLVREVPDAEFKLEQLIENVQREDLQPLDRAAGFAELKARGLDAVGIATKVGMARSTVELGLRLNDLVDAGKKALREGLLPLGAANELALVPVELQGKALERLVKGRRYDQELTVNFARELLRGEFRLELGEAVFDQKDATLVADAGACTSCPKRTGAQPELFGEKKPDVCTDIACYRKKEGAWLKRQEEAGRKVMAATQVKQVFETYGSEPRVKYSADFVLADDKDYSGGNKSYRSRLGKAAADKIVLARSPQGPVVEVIKRSDLPTEKTSSAAPKHQKSAAEKKREFQHKVNKAVAARALRAFNDANGTHLKPGAVHRAAVAGLLVELQEESKKQLATLLELTFKPGYGGPAAALEKYSKDLDPDALGAFVVQLAGARCLTVSPYTQGRDEHLVELCKLANTDLVFIKTEIEHEHREAAKQKAAAKAGKKTAPKKASKREGKPELIIHWATHPNGKLLRVGKGLSGITYKVEKGSATIGAKFTLLTQTHEQLKAGGSSVYGTFNSVNPDSAPHAPLLSVANCVELADALEARELKERAVRS